MNNYHWRAVSTPPNGPLNIKLGKPRRDGKTLVTYCFTGKAIRKLESADKVREIESSPEYRVIQRG